MPMLPPKLEADIKKAVFDELQAQFLNQAPEEHQDQVTDQNDKLAGAVSKCAAVIIDHLKQNMEMPGTVIVNTTVSGAGTGPGNLGAPVVTVVTGAGVGTGMAPPGSFL